MSERQRRLFFVAIFALVFYLVGASFVQSFVSYPVWREVGASEFKSVFLATFWGGALFALGVSLVRFLLVVQP